METKDKVVFKRKLFKVGGSEGITIPAELLDYIGAESEDTLCVIGDTGKKGKYIAVFKGAV